MIQVVSIITTCITLNNNSNSNSNTISNIYADSHISSTSVEAGAAAKQATSLKNTKYSDITSTHVFYAISMETAGSWDTQATELIEELDRRITEATEDPKETTYLFQRISITIQRGNALSFFNTYDRKDV